MDGVLADFDTNVKTLTGKYPYEHENSRWWKDIMQYQKAGNEFWYELKPLPDAMALWNYIKDYDVEILTSGGNPQFKAGSQKLRWIKRYLGPGIKVNVVQRSAEKANFADPHSILIDDMNKSIDPYIAAGGIGILHTSAADTIKKLKSYK